jgi:hypothetical protein
MARGYLRPTGRRVLKMVVSLPSGSGKAEAFVDGESVQVKVAKGVARFTLRADGGRTVDWGVVRN